MCGRVFIRYLYYVRHIRKNNCANNNPPVPKKRHRQEPPITLEPDISNVSSESDITNDDLQAPAAKRCRIEPPIQSEPDVDYVADAEVSPSTISTRKQAKIICPDCEEIFESPGELKEHQENACQIEMLMTTDYATTHTCQVCSAKFLTKQDRQSHGATEHPLTKVDIYVSRLEELIIFTHRYVQNTLTAAEEFMQKFDQLLALYQPYFIDTSHSTHIVTYMRDAPPITNMGVCYNFTNGSFDQMPLHAEHNIQDTRLYQLNNFLDLSHSSATATSTTDRLVTALRALKETSQAALQHGYVYIAHTDTKYYLNYIIDTEDHVYLIDAQRDIIYLLGFSDIDMAQIQSHSSQPTSTTRVTNQFYLIENEQGVAYCSTVLKAPELTVDTALLLDESIDGTLTLSKDPLHNQNILF